MQSSPPQPITVSCERTRSEATRRSPWPLRQHSRITAVIFGRDLVVRSDAGEDDSRAGRRWSPIDRGRSGRRAHRRSRPAGSWWRAGGGRADRARRRRYRHRQDRRAHRAASRTTWAFPTPLPAPISSGAVKCRPAFLTCCHTARYQGRAVWRMPASALFFDVASAYRRCRDCNGRLNIDGCPSRNAGYPQRVEGALSRHGAGAPMQEPARSIVGGGN